MRRLEAKDLKEMNLIKHYRIIRQWAAKNNNLTSADIELLIYLDCIDIFSKIDFKMGAYSYSWDNRRWNRLLQEDWIKVWRKRPTSERRNVIMLGRTYTDTVLKTSINNVNKDKHR